MSTIYSTELTNINAGVGSFPHGYGNVIKQVIGRVSVTSADTGVGDIIHMVRVPSSALISSIRLFCNDLDSGGSPAVVFDLGVYAAKAFTVPISGTDTSYAVGAVIDDNRYLDNSALLQGAITSGTECILGGGKGISAFTNKVWEDLGFDKDPNCDLYLSITIVTAPATHADGGIVLVANYTDQYL